MKTNKLAPNLKYDELFERLGKDGRLLKETIGDMVEGRRQLKEQYREELEDYDREMLTFLWRCRSLLSTVAIARMIGLSRQRLYEKWSKFGFDTNEVTK